MVQQTQHWDFFWAHNMGCISEHSIIALQAQECENLMRVVRELTASRSKLVAGKSVMAERFAELQAEYIKVLRIAELSRAASRSNLAKADKATNLAKQVH